jgi:hypothetical protein
MFVWMVGWLGAIWKIGMWYRHCHALTGERERVK